MRVKTLRQTTRIRKASDEKRGVNCTVETCLVDVLRNRVRSLRLGKASLDDLDPLGGEVLQREDVRSEADPVLICQGL